MRVTFLGTGTSRGIPVIGCGCEVCKSNNPENKRLRTSVLIESEVTVVIDASVDFRTQMLRQDVRSLDAVVLTHAHVDHILGLDDVYPFNIRSGTHMPIYASSETLNEVRKTFRHLFSERKYPGIPSLALHPVDGPFQIGELHFEPIPVVHGRLPILGYRIGSFAFITDVSEIPEQSFEKLQGVKYLALDALRERSHYSHFSLGEAVEAAERIGATQTYLVHMCHDLEHQSTNRELPDSVALAYDGLVWEVEGDEDARS